MSVRIPGIGYPAPLRRGDLIGVTAPSSGVAPRMRARLAAGVAALEARGFEVVVGECMSGARVTSAPKAQRAAELTSMLCGPSYPPGAASSPSTCSTSSTGRRSSGPSRPGWSATAT